MQIPALCDHIDAWLKVVDANPSFFIHDSQDLKNYERLRPTLGDMLRLGRSVQSFEWRAFSEGAENRNSTWLKLEDIK